MGELVTDPKDPRLGHGVDTKQTDQHEAYLVLSEEERAKGFVRPVRTAYRHVGPPGPTHGLRPLTADEQRIFGGHGYVRFEGYPEGTRNGATGRFWKAQQLRDIGNGCGTVTTMSLPLAETYARDPHFYGATYCVRCQKHLAVSEFVWDGTDERVGS